MRDIDIVELDYHILPPIISLIDINKKELERIKDSLIRITKAIKVIQQTDYYPVMTFLASEKQLQIIRKYISVYHPGIEDPILYPIEEDYDIPRCVLKCSRILAEILQKDLQEIFSEEFPQIR